MKVLLRFNKKDNSFVDMQSAVDEYVHKYQDVEELPNKDGFFTSLEYDEKAKKAIMKYVEIPKSKEEEKIKELKEAVYAMQEQLLQNSN